MSEIVDSVDILLATCNSSEYVCAQIDSIIAQSYQSWRLLVSDDCSSDGTLELIRRRYPDEKRIVIVSEKRKFGSSAKNFISLIQHSQASYAMFCDHDDVWFSTKIADELKVIRDCENQEGVTLPCMVFSDAIIVDSRLNTISNSHVAYSDMPSKHRNLLLNRIVVHNPALGCTSMFNAPLRDIVKASCIRGEDIVMHDWLLAILASSFGYLIFLEEPTIFYRQTGGNAVGVRPKNRIDMGVIFRGRERFWGSVDQAAAIGEALGEVLPNKSRILIETYSQLRFMTPIERMKTCARFHYWKHGIRRLIGQVWYLVCGPA